MYQAAEDPPFSAYTDGFLLNVDLARVLYPIWKIFLYLDSRLEGSEFHKTVASKHSDIAHIVEESFHKRALWAHMEISGG